MHRKIGLNMLKFQVCAASSNPQSPFHSRNLSMHKHRLADLKIANDSLHAGSDKANTISL